jgi:hypothetical protein
MDRVAGGAKDNKRKGIEESSGQVSQRASQVTPAQRRSGPPSMFAIARTLLRQQFEGLTVRARIAMGFDGSAAREIVIRLTTGLPRDLAGMVMEYDDIEAAEAASKHAKDASSALERLVRPIRQVDRNDGSGPLCPYWKPFIQELSTRLHADLREVTEGRRDARQWWKGIRLENPGDAFSVPPTFHSIDIDGSEGGFFVNETLAQKSANGLTKLARAFTYYSHELMGRLGRENVEAFNAFQAALAKLSGLERPMGPLTAEEEALGGVMPAGPGGPDHSLVTLPVDDKSGRERRGGPRKPQRQLRSQGGSSSSSSAGAKVSSTSGPGAGFRVARAPEAASAAKPAGDAIGKGVTLDLDGVMATIARPGDHGGWVVTADDADGTPDEVAWRIGADGRTQGGGGPVEYSLSDERILQGRIVGRSGGGGGA